VSAFDQRNVDAALVGQMGGVNALDHLVDETHHLNTRKRFAVIFDSVAQVFDEELVADMEPVFAKIARFVFWATNG
jgi:hypothetical protein